MPFRFIKETTLGENIQRVLQEEIDKAFQHLTITEPPHKGIHEARKGHKKIRAVLRLVRYSIHSEHYSQANIYYRDTARILSNIRDATALIEAIDDLKSFAPLQFNTENYQIIKQQFVGRRNLLAKQALPEDELRETAANRLIAYQRETLALPVSGNHFNLIKRGLGKIYRQGWEGLQKVKAYPDMENIHDWRKRIKYLWYQLTLLSPVWPTMLSSLTKELKQLSDWLGTWRDAGLLLETIELEPDILPDQALVFHLTQIAENVRLKLLTASLQLGENIYIDPPKYFSNKTEKYWNNWKFNPNWVHSNGSSATQKPPLVKNFQEVLNQLPDPRNAVQATYVLSDIIFLITICLLAGKSSIYTMHKFLSKHTKTFLPLFPQYDRLPSASTLKRLLFTTNFQHVKELFTSWCQSYHKKLVPLINMPYEPLEMPGFPANYVSYATSLQHCSSDIHFSDEKEVIQTIVSWLRQS